MCLFVTSCDLLRRYLKDLWDTERYLGDHNVAVGCSASFDEAVQDVLRHLSGLTAACRPSNNHHRVVVNGAHDLLLKVFDRQLVTLTQDLENTGFILLHPPDVKKAPGQGCGDGI